MREFVLATLCTALLSCGGGGGGGGGGARAPAWSHDLGTSDFTAVAISADGSRVLAASEGRMVLLGSGGAVTWEATDPESGWTTSVDLSADGTHGVVGMDGKIFAVGTAGVDWSTSAEGNLPNPFGGLTWAGDQVAISDAGVIVAGNAHLMQVSGSASLAWALQYRSGGGVAMSADGSRVALDDHTYGQVVAVDGATGGVIGAWDRTDLVEAVAISADGTTIAAGGYAGVDVLDGDANHLWNFAPPSWPTTRAVSVSADGALIAAGGDDAKVRLFARGSSTPLWTYDQHSGGIFGVAISADGSTVASIGDWGAVSLVDAATGAPIREYRPGGGDTSTVAISADGREVAVGVPGGVEFFTR